MRHAIIHTITSALLCAGAAFVAWSCLRGWTTAWMPAAMFVCAVCLPLAAFGVISHKLSESPWLRARDVVAWGAQGALWAALLGAWALPQVRIAAAARAPNAALASCLHDEDGDVVRKCCEQLGQSATGHQAVLGRWLIDHAQMPMACAVQAFDGRTPEANSTARVLVERWEAQLLAPPAPPSPPAAPPAAEAEAPAQAASQPEPSLCELASHVRHMDRVPGTYSGLRLLQCALRSPSPEAQQCCAAQLHQLASRAGDWTSALGPPALTQRTSQSTRLLLLLPRLLNPADEGAAEQLRALRLDSPDARRWSLEAACSLVDHETPRVSAEASAHMQLALLMRGCDEVTGLTPREVRHVCARWGAEREVHPEADHDTQLMCAITRAEAVGQGTQHARVFLARARASARSAARSEDPLVSAILAAKIRRRNQHAPDPLDGSQPVHQLKGAEYDQIRAMFRARGMQIDPNIYPFMQRMAP